ncbi:DUF6415 family natural product biosynthesis protein [Streptomyces violarus]|uniref:DUF6415 family natural product biosynthesis protein n=1 Tax=Streptomyces violarus TaxID=67380 RepID=UPI0021C0B0AC|nr:DUF6415 family natural product biosynthesis protein [Streptomyces violarus]MCT9140340.1 DUF6415 family natural product biosynthesis protein [Streptomyces violarus]
MTEQQEHAPAADPIASLIAESFDAGRNYVTPERFRELDKLLREEIDRLKPIVQRVADRTPHRSRDWYAAVQAIEAAEHDLSYQAATTPIAGSIHVAELAQRIIELRKASTTRAPEVLPAGHGDSHPSRGDA